MNKIKYLLLVFTLIFKGCISEKDNSFISVSYSNDLAIEDGFDGRLLLMFSKKLKPICCYYFNLLTRFRIYKFLTLTVQLLNAIVQKLNI